MMELTHILDDCLGRLASGQGRTEVLALYPEHAHRLAPMLDAAARLTALSGARLSDPQKLRAKVALRQAMAERAQPRPRFLWPRLRALPTALVLAAVLVMALSVSAVAASKPGDMAYPLRIAVERVPTLVQFTPSGRAFAELAVADRRIADLGSHLASTGRANALALDALLEGEAAAAGLVSHLSDGERAGVAARIMAHADALETLAGVGAAPADAQRLRAAAERSRQIADNLRQNSPPPVAPPTAPPPVSGDSGTAKPEPTATSTPTSLRPTSVPSASGSTETTAVAPTAIATPAPTDRALPTRTPRPRPRLTAIVPRPVIATRLPGQHPLPARTPDPGATASATAPLAPDVGPTSIVTRPPTVVPPRPAHTPWRPAATALPTRTPLPPGTTTRVRPGPPQGTLIPTAAPTSIPADTPTPEPGVAPGVEPRTPGPQRTGGGHP